MAIFKYIKDEFLVSDTGFSHFSFSSIDSYIKALITHSTHLLLRDGRDPKRV